MSEEPELPGTGGEEGARDRGTSVTLATVEALAPRGTGLLDQALRAARIEVSLPEAIWDRAALLEDIVVQTLIDPRRDLDAQYSHLRIQFMNDTGVRDILPDFVEDNETLQGAWRQLDRMGVPQAEQLEHVSEAFRPLTEFMDLTFRPGRSDYRREPWPSAPPRTPVAQLPDDGVIEVDPVSWTGRLDPASRARRVLSLAPLAMQAIDQLIETAERAQRDNAPPETLDEPRLMHLRELHAELGELIRQTRGRRDLGPQLDRVAGLFQRAFTVMQSTGDLLARDVPPLVATMVPAWATYAICETMLHMKEESSAAMGAAAWAANASMRATRTGRGTRERQDGPNEWPPN